MSDYDAYHLWLGIPPPEQPPNYYRLLGVDLFEQNQEVIRHAADRQLGHVRRLAVNKYVQVGQQLLDEIATAKICLLRPEKRTEYDARLRERLKIPPQNQPDQLSLPEQQAAISSINSPETAKLTPPNPPPVPAKPAAPLPKEGSVLIGSDAHCDIVLDRPEISSLHCQLLRSNEQLFLKDLMSTNGTYVNQNRIRTHLAISPLDWITLGKQARFKPDISLFPKALRGYKVLFVGRHAECEIQRSHESISLVHARIVAVENRITIEDLGSTNGTALIQADGSSIPLPAFTPEDITRCVAVLFGGCRLEIAELLPQ